MQEENTKDEIKQHKRLRNCILKYLYETFRDFPHVPIEMDQLVETCQVSPKDLNWNIIYLEKCGFIELSKSYAAPPFIACSATITVEGIDLVEDESAFNRRFPDDKENM